MKQLNLENWEELFKHKKKRKIALGHGYNPEALKDGITEYKFSHKMDDGRSLYVFKPNLPYRLFPLLSKSLGYKIHQGTILKDINTEIQNDYLITDDNPDEIVKKINKKIKDIFEKYEPISD